ncbi:hypothetical protein [Microcoleus sp. bin38.metabat.b11b12b14.051]|uniref:hypothetical protein n=1 Tax=Microcoleus sp. bin38.metabat.b11b12b14.051 TaxID=2742709 RepID=UPI0025D62867|nr:hypothetical protein [Microcoleus sp. bin38.metabat.b11b12b14.051]
MHKNLYDRIVLYAQDIALGNPLPKFNFHWQNDGLETAREVYTRIRFFGGETAEEIASNLEISPEYAKQIILALQNGGVQIGAVSEESNVNGRHKHKYFMRAS